MKISIKNVTKTLSGNRVLDCINLDLQSGMIYGFVGKNGSGKTMLMRAICGLIVPTSGEIAIDGQILGKKISFPQSVGALIENPGFISSYTGYKNLKYLAQIQNIASERDILNAMKVVGLDPYDKKKYRKFSLGMKQKLGIAAAIMENPKLLILDEPFNALDEETVPKIREIIYNFKKGGSLVILACHDKSEIDMLCDVVIEIKSGKITNISERYRNEEK